MKKLFLSLVFIAISVIGFTQKFDQIDVTANADGVYSNVVSGVKVTGHVQSGMKIGTWIECHPNAELPHFIAQFIDNQLDGLYLEIDKQGNLQRQMEYKNGALEGTSMKWGRGGRLTEMFTYKNGLKDGPSKICYDRGTIQEESNFKEGKRDGVTVWYAYGEKEQGPKVAMYTYKDGVFDGVQETYYENGAVKTRKMFANNVQHGLAIEFYEDGSVKSETEYKRGEIKGKVKEYAMGEKQL